MTYTIVYILAAIFVMLAALVVGLMVYPGPKKPRKSSPSKHL